MRVRTLIVGGVAMVVACGMGVMATAQDEGASERVPGGLGSVTQPSRPGVAATDEFRTYTNGAGASLLKFSVSSHGNISRFESPAGFEHIRIAVIREGYALSSSSTPTYWDSGDSESVNWGGTFFSEPGFGVLPLTIIRNTADGVFRLTMKYTRNAVQEVFITTTVTNLSGISRSDVRLARYFDGDLTNDVDGDFASRTFDSALISEPGGGGDTLELTGTKYSPYGNLTDVQTFGGFNVAVTSQASLAVLPTGLGDYTGRHTYLLGTIGAGNSKTVVHRYSHT